MAQNQTKAVYSYTQHENTIRIIESTCNVNIVRLRQDRTKDVVEDVLSQLPSQKELILYAVMPLDKAVQLRETAPWIRLRLLQLDGKIIEQITGRPYDPKAQYDDDVVRRALKVYEIHSGSIRYLSVEEFLREVNGKSVAVFNDTLREAIRLVADRFKASVELVKTSCDSCVEVNPLGYKSGYRISFPGTVGRLTPEQMAEMIISGGARIYYVDVQAVETPLCP
jgi:hypothetical protein